VIEPDAELWAMERSYLEAFVARHLKVVATAPNAADADVLINAHEARQREPLPFTNRGGVAVIPIKGVILKDVPWLYDLFGINATSTRRVAASVCAALADTDVASILLAVDSPGGTVAGVQELADIIFEARDAKPLNAHIEDLGASAAYWLASQASHIAANETAAVGGIGVYTVYYDRSEQAAALGIKVHVIASGEYKGAGVPGSSLTGKQLAAIQDRVDGIAAIFQAAVARGRGMEAKAVAKLATGRVWLAAKAVGNGLINSIASETAQEKETSMGNSSKPTTTGAGAIAAYERLIEELVAKGDPAPESTVIKKHPRVHAAYLEAVNRE